MKKKGLLKNHFSAWLSHSCSSVEPFLWLTPAGDLAVEELLVMWELQKSQEITKKDLKPLVPLGFPSRKRKKLGNLLRG